MVALTGSVGDAAANATHDVAIAQLMLRLVRNAKGVAYYGAAYSGNYEQGIKTAIAQFQKDHSIALGGQEKSGLLTATGPTLAKLNTALPAKYAAMRIIPGTNTVYMPAQAAEAGLSASTISGKADLEVAFRQKVVAVVNGMYNLHAIALEVVGPGWRRSFAEQSIQTKTGAGPGESNHNFGRAVDLGFRHFTWVDQSGNFVKEGGWLGSAALGGKKSEQLWTARDAIAINTYGLFLTSYQGERVHLQSFSDATANARKSLATLLTRVGLMKWEFKNNQYHADLGCGGKLVSVGTAKQIWGSTATISAAEVASAASGKTLQALASHAVLAELSAVKRHSKAPASKTAATAALTAKDVTAADLTLIKTALKADFQAADAHWRQWVPVL